MKNFMKSLEKDTAKYLKKHLYYWYLSEKGTHEEKITGLFVSLENIVFPPMTEKLKAAIISYVEIKNAVFEATIINQLSTKALVRRAVL